MPASRSYDPPGFASGTAARILAVSATGSATFGNGRKEMPDRIQAFLHAYRDYAAYGRELTGLSDIEKYRFRTSPVKAPRGGNAVLTHQFLYSLAAHPQWNPIEYRLFSEISKNWVGGPLDSYQKILCFTGRRQRWIPSMPHGHGSIPPKPAGAKMFGHSGQSCLSDHHRDGQWPGNVDTAIPLRTRQPKLAGEPTNAAMPCRSTPQADLAIEDRS
jgi:hypothetical protein